MSFFLSIVLGLLLTVFASPALACTGCPTAASSTVRSVDINETTRFKNNLDRRLERLADRMELNGRRREAIVTRNLLQVFSTFEPSVVEVRSAGSGESVFSVVETCPGSTCFRFVLLDFEKAGIHGVAGAWMPEIATMVLDAQRKSGDGYVPYLAVHELVHVMFSVMEAGQMRLELPPKFESISEDVVAKVIEGWLLNAATDGAYYREIRRMARQVRAGTRTHVERHGVTFAPMTPELYELLSDQVGTRADAAAIDLFAQLVTFDLNVRLMSHTDPAIGELLTQMEKNRIDIKNREHAVMMSIEP